MKIAQPVTLWNTFVPASSDKCGKWVAKGFKLEDPQRLVFVEVSVLEPTQIESVALGGGADLLRESPLLLTPGTHLIPLRDAPICAAPNEVTLLVSSGALFRGLVGGQPLDAPYLHFLPEGYGRDWMGGNLAFSKGRDKYTMLRCSATGWACAPAEDGLFSRLRIYAAWPVTVDEVCVGGSANLLKESPVELEAGWHELPLKAQVLVRPPNRVFMTCSKGEPYAAEVTFTRLLAAEEALLSLPAPQDTQNHPPEPPARLDRLGRPERLLCSAIYLDDGVERARTKSYPVTGALYCGLRHADCWTTIFAVEMSEERRRYLLNHTVQGFLTSTGRFVDREEGLVVARAAGQVGELQCGGDELTSEELW